VRYRYYVSHALLQGRRDEAGSVGRAAAPDVEQLVVEALRGAVEHKSNSSDQDLMQRRLDRAVVHRDRIEVTLRRDGDSDADATPSPSTVSIPFVSTHPVRKGVSHSPNRQNAMDGALRISLLTAIARSRSWIEAILNDPASDFNALAISEKLAERHVRFLAPLAYLSPRIIEAIAECRAPANLTITQLARSLPMSWAKQEKQLGIV
jgi:site-specific DNA recombinase